MTWFDRFLLWLEECAASRLENKFIKRIRQRVEKKTNNLMWSSISFDPKRRKALSLKKTRHWTSTFYYKSFKIVCERVERGTFVRVYKDGKTVMSYVDGYAQRGYSLTDYYDRGDASDYYWYLLGVL